MTTMIKLTGINKIYRTEEIETQALENVNLEVKRIPQHHGTVRMRKVNLAQHHGLARHADFWNH